MLEEGKCHLFIFVQSRGKRWMQPVAIERDKRFASPCWVRGVSCMAAEVGSNSGHNCDHWLVGPMHQKANSCIEGF